MATDGSTDKNKTARSSWHQIRSTPAGATAKTDVVEAAKQAQSEDLETLKAKAVAASAETSTATTAASIPDASTIASIVDSVLANLRPKIVEEIAKKLAGK